MTEALAAPEIINIKIKQNKILVIDISQSSLYKFFDYQLEFYDSTSWKDTVTLKAIHIINNSYQIIYNYNKGLYNKTYNIRIRTLNDTNVSSWVHYTMNREHVQLKLYKYPMEPQGLQLVNQRSNGDIEIRWNEVQNGLGTTGGYLIEKYKIYIYTTPTFITTISGIPLDTTETSYVIPGNMLIYGMKHFIKVSAFDEIGQEGNKSHTIEITPTSKPSAPIQITATGYDTQISVSWINTSSNGSEITGYRLYYNISGSTDIYEATNVAINILERTAIITQLQNGLFYSVYVTAINSNGEGERSKGSVYVKPASRPLIYDLSSEIGTSQIIFTGW